MPLEISQIKNLNELHLAHNLISKLEVDSFCLHALKKLKYLNLQSNAIESVYLPGFENLEILNLNSNKLTRIMANSFTVLKKDSIHTLLVAYNQIKWIESSAFKNVC